MITGLREKFPCNIIGYSDHTLPDEAMTSLVTAYLLGAVIIEKHFTHDKSLPGNDHYHAMDVNDLICFINLINKIDLSLGRDSQKMPIDDETISRKNARRSIVLSKNVQKGHKLSAEDLTYKRPGTGISPLHWDEVLGKLVINNLKEDHILEWIDLKQ